MKNMLSDFFTALQFLTRIQVTSRIVYSPEILGRSVKYFPLIGCIIGGILAGSIYLTQNVFSFKTPIHTLAVGIIFFEIVITGGLHCDGLMDTFDGIFSGRSPDRMLEIMKDSRVGAFGVISFCILILGKYSLFLDLGLTENLFAAIIAAPVVGRMGSVVAINLFPYARTNGMGRAFCEYSSKKDLFVAAMTTIVILFVIGKTALIAGVAAMVVCFGMAKYIKECLGGLTGDIYGAIIEVTEVTTLAVFTVCQ